MALSKLWSAIQFWKGKVEYEGNDENGSILRYDVNFLLQYGWSTALRGNVFNNETIIGLFASVAASTLMALVKCPVHTPSSASTKGAHSHAPTPSPRSEFSSKVCLPLPSGLVNITLLTISSFLIGLFANTLLNRWWRLRMHLEDQMNGNIEIMILLSSVLVNSKMVNDHPEKLEEAKQACYAVYRYLNLATNLVVLNANKPVDLQILHQKGILTDSEYLNIQTMDASPNIAYSWINARFQKLAYAGFLGEFPGKGEANLKALQAAAGTARQNAIAVGVFISTQLPYPFVQLVAFVVYACIIQVIFVCGGTVGAGLHANDYGLVVTSYLTLILHVLALRTLVLLYDIICNPLGDDAADFPSSTYLAKCDKAMFGIMNNVFCVSITSLKDARIKNYKVDESRGKGKNKTRLHFHPDARRDHDGIEGEIDREVKSANPLNSLFFSAKSSMLMPWELSKRDVQSRGGTAAGGSMPGSPVRARSVAASIDGEDAGASPDTTFNSVGGVEEDDDGPVIGVAIKWARPPVMRAWNDEEG